MTASPTPSSPADPYDADVIPLPDVSMRYFEDALVQTATAGRRRVREVLRQCWRDIRNQGITP